MTEILQDASTVLVPANDMLVQAALDSLRMARLFDGFRGRASASRQAVLDQVQLMVRLMQARPELIEIEINPVMVSTNSAICADALISVISTDA
jgi:aryl carrier-like protein